MTAPTGSCLYIWVNGTYSNPVQNGLQSLHMGLQMAADYLIDTWGKSDAAVETFKSYLTCKEPFVRIKAAANLRMLKDIEADLRLAGIVLDIPFSSFYESEDANGGMMTATGAVIPDDLLLTDDECRILADQNIELKRGLLDEVLDQFRVSLYRPTDLTAPSLQRRRFAARVLLNFWIKTCHRA